MLTCHPEQLIESDATHSPTVFDDVHRSAGRESPPTPTPRSRTKQTRRAHVLFPTVPTQRIEQQSGSITAVAMDAYPPPRSYNNLSSTSDHEVSFLSNMAEENFSGASSPTMSTPSLDTSSVSSTPFSSPPSTPELPSSTIGDPVVVSAEGVVPTSTEYNIDMNPQVLPSELEIGKLGKRRGFKGAPLFTTATSRKSTFLEVPPVFSPRHTKSPLVTLIKQSSFDAEKQRAIEVKQVPAALQEDFDLHDPFGTNSDSYYLPHVVNTTISHPNLFDFSAYESEGPVRTSSLKRKQTSTNVHSRSTFELSTTTSIYESFNHSDNDASTKATSTRPRSNTRHDGLPSHESSECQPALSSIHSTLRTGDIHTVNHVAEPIISIQDAAAIDEIVSIVSGYACPSEELAQMDAALPDSPVQIPRDDWYYQSTHFYEVPDPSLDTSVQYDLLIRPARPNNTHGHRIHRNTEDSQVIRRSPEYISTDTKKLLSISIPGRGERPRTTVYPRSNNHDIAGFGDEIHSIESADQTNPQQSHPTHSGQQAPKRFSGLRPLLLPMIVSRQRSLSGLGTPPARFSYPTTAHDRPLPPPAYRQTPSGWNRNNTAATTPFPARSYSLPPGWPVPPTHTYVVTGYRYHPESTPTTTSVSTPISSPERRSKALEDVLNLLDEADFTIKTKIAAVSEEYSFHMTQQRRVMYDFEDAQWLEDAPCAI